MKHLLIYHRKAFPSARSRLSTSGTSGECSESTPLLRVRDQIHALVHDLAGYHPAHTFTVSAVLVFVVCLPSRRYKDASRPLCRSSFPLFPSSRQRQTHRHISFYTSVMQAPKEYQLSARLNVSLTRSERHFYADTGLFIQVRHSPLVPPHPMLIIL